MLVSGLILDAQPLVAYQDERRRPLLLHVNNVHTALFSSDCHDQERERCLFRSPSISNHIFLASLVEQCIKSWVSGSIRIGRRFNLWVSPLENNGMYVKTLDLEVVSTLKSCTQDKVVPARSCKLPWKLIPPKNTQFGFK